MHAANRIALSVTVERWNNIQPFRIARTVISFHDLVVVRLDSDGASGWGEADGVDYHGESPDSMVRQIESVRDRIEAGISLDDLQTLLPPGGARNALDCAMWDLRAKQTGVPAWQQAALSAPRALQTYITIPIGTEDEMIAAAIRMPSDARIKVKVGTPGDLDRLEAIHQARPDAAYIVDANEGWTIDSLRDALPALLQLGVRLIEQPLPRSDDAALLAFQSPIPICADEACDIAADIPRLVGKYDAVNIKLDKAGGLTEALSVARAARQHGLRTMVGCMGGTSLAMAPASLVGQLCEFVDLDAPLFSTADRPNAMVYTGAVLQPYDAKIWG